MLESGTRISVTGEEGEAAKVGTVQRCNARGTSCQVQWSGQEDSELVNLNRVAYQVLEGAGSAERTSSDSGDSASISNSEASIGGAAEQQPSGAQDRSLEVEEDAAPATVSGLGKDEEELEVEVEGLVLPELDAFEGSTAEAVERLTGAVAEPAALAQPSQHVSALARAAAKALFAYAAATDHPNGSDAAAAAAAQGPGVQQAELHVDGFDAEQIWLQLELAATPAQRRLRKLLKRVGPEPRLLDPDTEEALDIQLNGGWSGEEEDEEEEEEVSASGEESEEDGLPAHGVDGGASASEEDDDDDADGDDDAPAGPASGSGEGADELAAAPGEAKRAASRKRKRRKDAKALPGEDEFMRIRDMQRFIEEAEAAEAAREDEEDGAEDEEEEEEAGRRAPANDDALDDSEAELEQLLQHTAAAAGRQRKRRRQKSMDAGMHEAGGGSGDDAGSPRGGDMMYDDLFGGGSEDDEAVPRKRRPAHDEEAMSEDDEEDEDGDEDEGDEEVKNEDHDRHANGAALGAFHNGAQPGSEAEDEDELGGEPEERKSTHERRLERVAAQVAALEEEALADKDWFMRGETDAAERPLNSALEIDLDYERTVRPPPQPTEEVTASLEDVIRRRIADARFDDVVRLAPPPLPRQTTVVELDDKKSAKGLGEVYEEEYVRATAGSAPEDKADALRQEARTLLKALSLKLDALSHFHYAPKPVIEDMQVRSDVPALAMEEVAPQVVSEAAMRVPEEVFRAGAGGATAAGETELSREDRKRARAAKKRASKKRTAQKGAERKARAVSAGGEAPLVARKSEAAEVQRSAAARKERKKGKAGAQQAAGARMNYSKSSAVFGRLQEQRDAAAAGIKLRPGQQADKARMPTSHLKL